MTLCIFKVLEEIKQQDVVEEFSAPVFSLELVLVVPQKSDGRPTSLLDPERTIKTASTHSSYLKQMLEDRARIGSGKKVKFHDQPGSSGLLTLVLHKQNICTTGLNLWNKRYILGVIFTLLSKFILVYILFVIYAPVICNHVPPRAGE